MAGKTDCDIMLSYDPDDRKLARKIKKELKEEGFICWMDKHKMPGARQDAIAAVDACEVFLMCYSKEYFDNKDCKGEAEYANSSQKKIIPCLLDRDYNPKGWLGYIKGGKSVFDFSGKYPFQSVMKKLIREIRQHVTPSTEISLDELELSDEDDEEDDEDDEDDD